MKQQLLLLTLLTANMATSAGGGSSKAMDAQIKIAKMDVLKQRLADIKKNSPDIDENTHQWLLKKFSGKSFASVEAILKKYADIVDGIEDVYSSDADFAEDDVLREQGKIEKIQPLILQLILKDDYPSAYAQLIPKKVETSQPVIYYNGKIVSGPPSFHKELVLKFKNQ